MKWLGAFLIFAACGYIGFQSASQYRAEEKTLRKLIFILDFMSSELQYRLTPLPELCRQATKEADGRLRKLFVHFSDELDRQIAPDVKSCMMAALTHCPDLPKLTSQCMLQLGSSMGRFDLPGQVQAIDEVRSLCRSHLNALESGRDTRLRSYQTLGLCAGAALVILFV